jgi:hypothetical protein
MSEEAEPIEGIEDVVWRILDDVSTAFPATIIGLGKVDGLVSVQPNHKFKAARDDTEIEPPAINNVVLVYPGRTGQTIQRPPKEALIGSKVLVVACEHSLTEWRSSAGKSVYPSANRRFDANDAVAILGLYPETLQWPNPQLPATWEFLIKEGFKIKMGTQTADFPGLAYQILFLMSAGVNTSTGQFTNISQITPLLTKLLTIVHPQTA